MFGRGWTTLAHYQGHEINQAGQIRNAKTGRVLESSVNQSGVRYVSIKNTTTQRYENKAIGQLVAETFIGPSTANEETILHLDGNTENNRADNLMWATRWHAMAYHIEINRRDFSLRKRVKDETGRIYANVGEAAMATGCLPSAIDYAMRYHESLHSDAHANFYHHTYPGGHIFTSV